MERTTQVVERVNRLASPITSATVRLFGSSQRGHMIGRWGQRRQPDNASVWRESHTHERARCVYCTYCTFYGRMCAAITQALMVPCSYGTYCNLVLRSYVTTKLTATVYGFRFLGCSMYVFLHHSPYTQDHSPCHSRTSTHLTDKKSAQYDARF